nr:ribonuclease H-like domain-containing protein [Tanacetum cinerariifolium]
MAEGPASPCGESHESGGDMSPRARNVREQDKFLPNRTGFKKHNQLLKLMQFFMGLDDSYMQIKSSILSRETLPDVRSAYATISSEESHRVVVGSIAEKVRSNVKKQGVSNNNYVGKSSSSGFTYKQMATLISLIKENKVRKNVQANMAGRPNGTEAYISKIGNLRLCNGLTLYDVMDIPEYCVTLDYVHKLVKENKVIVAFDENKCYFLNQDLNMKNVMWIGEQCKGLYYYSDKDHVLNVLKDSLNFDKSDNTGCCEICQRAKQTREPFPLNDHKSKNLGDLVHLDLWRPYKVASFEGFRFFLTVVDDYTRALWVYLIKSKDKDSEVGKNDSANVFQDVNHVNFFDIEYPEIPNDDERVANDLNKVKNFVVIQDEEVATLEKNVFSEGNLDKNKSSSQGIQNVRRSSGEIDRYKARLVAQGFRQKERIDYEETFSSVVKMVTVRRGCLYETTRGYFPSDNKVCRLKKSLYGLKQASRQWNAKLTSTLIENRFSQSKSDYSLYTKSNKGVFLALLVYVDDIIITGNSVSEIEKFKVFLKSKIMIKDLGKLKYFLGIKVVDIDKGICLNQRKYVLDLLSEYGMLACKPAKTPFMSKLVISNEASDKDPLLENITDYQKLMGKLIYLTNTRPDISYDVHCLGQFMDSPLTSHLKITFKILRYLKSCHGLGVHITKTSGMFLTAYSDAD